MSEIRALVDQFVAQLQAAVRKEALQALRDALEGGPSKARSSKGLANPGKAASTPSRAVGETQKRRTAKDIEAEANRLLIAIKAKPGSTSEELKKAARVLPKDFSLPIQKLLDERRIKKRGEKRATKYFPA